jgi:hypothetical protein
LEHTLGHHISALKLDYRRPDAYLCQLKLCPSNSLTLGERRVVEQGWVPDNRSIRVAVLMSDPLTTIKKARNYFNDIQSSSRASNSLLGDVGMAGTCVTSVHCQEPVLSRPYSRISGSAKNGRT